MQEKIIQLSLGDVIEPARTRAVIAAGLDIACLDAARSDRPVRG